jgi:predicted nucleic acid-binding protein
VSAKAKPYLLDTSALLTLIENEEGAEKVEAVLREQQTLIPWLCLLELHSISQQERGNAEANTRYALTKALGSSLLWEADETLLLTAASFKAKYRLSLADTIIAAFAVKHEAILLHKDPEYEVLKTEVTQEPLPYKR